MLPPLPMALSGLLTRTLMLDLETTSFHIVQNKLHFAVSGKTAAELISERADSSKPNMGLTAWKGPKVRKGDVTIAKNYLNEKEMEGLNRIVTIYKEFGYKGSSARSD